MAKLTGEDVRKQLAKLRAAAPAEDHGMSSRRREMTARIAALGRGGDVVAEADAALAVLADLRRELETASDRLAEASRGLGVDPADAEALLAGDALDDEAREELARDEADRAAEAKREVEEAARDARPRSPRLAAASRRGGRLNV